MVTSLSSGQNRVLLIYLHDPMFTVLSEDWKSGTDRVYSSNQVRSLIQIAARRVIGSQRDSGVIEEVSQNEG